MFAIWFYLGLLIATLSSNWVWVRIKARRRLKEAEKVVRQYRQE